MTPEAVGSPILPLKMKPVAIKNSTYLLIPKDIARLLDIERVPTCTITVRLEDNHCSLIYSFPRRPEPETNSAREPHLLPKAVTPP